MKRSAMMRSAKKRLARGGWRKFALALTTMSFRPERVRAASPRSGGTCFFFAVAFACRYAEALASALAPQESGLQPLRVTSTSVPIGNGFSVTIQTCPASSRTTERISAIKTAPLADFAVSVPGVADAGMSCVSRRICHRVTPPCRETRRMSLTMALNIIGLTGSRDASNHVPGAKARIILRLYCRG
jgi:hypothetical protein